jgi:hypothetical protein
VEAQMSTTTTEQQSETSANAAATDEDYYYVLLSSDSEQSEEADVDAEETDSDSADSSDSTLDDVLKTSSEIIDIYHQTWVGKFLKSVGLEKLCNNVFGTLSTVEENGEQYNFHDEVVAFSGVYNDVLTLQSNGGFDLTNADSIKNLENIIDSCYNSKLAGKLIDEVIVTAVNKWNENQTFLGISKPNIDGYNDVIDSLLNALASAEDKHATLISTTKMLNSIMVTAKSLNSEDGLNIDSIGDLLNDITSDPVITDLAKQVIVGNIQTISEQSGLGDYADAFSEAITGIFSVDYSETDGNISDEISVITSTLNIAQKLSDSNEEVKVDADDAEAVVTALVNSTVLYDKIIDKNGEINSLIQSSIKDISEDDKTTISTAIEAAKDGLDETEDSAKLAKLQAIADLFGIDLSEQNGLPEDAAE